jgi:hypothetical protein
MREKRHGVDDAMVTQAKDVEVRLQRVADEDRVGSKKGREDLEDISECCLHLGEVRSRGK